VRPDGWVVEKQDVHIFLAVSYWPLAVS